jgi:rhodanese-related sulfurtransferase/DNA-binding transcriptional ArsR family regulator
VEKQEAGDRPFGDRAFKDAVYEQLARIGKAIDSPKRLELLDLLAQGERSVETLARLAGLGVTNASAHLQALARARLVATRKRGTRVYYRLADEQVVGFLATLRTLAAARLAELDQAVRAFVQTAGDPEPVTRAELAARLARGEVLVLDVRPAEEYTAGHIPGARSIPPDRLEAELADLERELERLPRQTGIVAYCRGPYCVYAPTAVRLLRERGVAARRLEDGFPEWRLAGLPVATAA